MFQCLPSSFFSVSFPLLLLSCPSLFQRGFAVFASRKTRRSTERQKEGWSRESRGKSVMSSSFRNSFSLPYPPLRKRNKKSLFNEESKNNIFCLCIAGSAGGREDGLGGGIRGRRRGELDWRKEGLTFPRRRRPRWPRTLRKCAPLFDLSRDGLVITPENHEMILSWLLLAVECLNVKFF